MEKEDAVCAAICMMRLNKTRDQALGGELFGNPAWDILIALMSEDGSLTAAKLATRIGTPLSLVKRWLDILDDRGLVARLKAPRSPSFALTDAAVVKVGAVLANLRLSSELQASIEAKATSRLDKTLLNWAVANAKPATLSE